MLTFERTGPRGGPTLVLLHPMGADLRFRDPCRDLWQDRFAYLPAAGAAHDLPGTLTLPRQPHRRVTGGAAPSRAGRAARRPRRTDSLTC